MFHHPCAQKLAKGHRPDHCDGTFDANCDPSRAYTDISSIISGAGQTALLDDMNTYWKDNKGNDKSFWAHEWGKHGTCISTLQPNCYTSYVPQEEVVAYFQKTVDLFKTLDSFQVCRNEARLNSGDILTAASLVPIGCWYCSFVYHYLHGRRDQRRSQGSSRS